MPIKPENKKRYPANWKEIRKDILKRADNKCEFCGIENYAIRENGPVYLDELEPNRGDMNTEIMPDCGIMCYLAH